MSNKHRNQAHQNRPPQQQAPVARLVETPEEPAPVVAETAPTPVEAVPETVVAEPQATEASAPEPTEAPVPPTEEPVAVAAPVAEPAKAAAAPVAEAKGPGKKRVVVGADQEPKMLEINANDILSLVKSWATAMGLSPSQVAAISIAIVKQHGGALEAIASVFPPVPADV